MGGGAPGAIAIIMGGDGAPGAIIMLGTIPGAIITGAGAAVEPVIILGAVPGAIAIIMGGGGAPGAIAIIMGGGGAPGAIIITGLAMDAGVASITLGLGWGDARPAPIKARFESSIVTGAGSIIRTYVETFGLGTMNVSMVQAIKSPRSTLIMDFIYLCQRIFP
jgi:hypothetical protein